MFKWENVSDSLPDPIVRYIDVLAYSPTNGFVSALYFDRDMRVFLSDPGGFDAETVSNVIHWAYMPDPPK